MITKFQIYEQKSFDNNFKKEEIVYCIDNENITKDKILKIYQKYIVIFKHAKI